MNVDEKQFDRDRHIRDRYLAECVRAACEQAAIRGFQDAGMRGLCAEGRSEAAVSAIRTLDLRPYIDRMD